jgi:hypothetical protein
MKPAPEDYEEDLDPFLALLAMLWQDRLSIDIKVATNSIFIHPEPPIPMNDIILEHYEQLEHWLPGICDSCQEWSMQRSALPFGAHAHLCDYCKERAIEVYEKHGWPNSIWYNHEQ